MHFGKKSNKYPNMQDDYTLLIQGPANTITTLALNAYAQSHTNIVWSTWNDPATESILDRIPTSIKVIQTDVLLNSNLKNIDNNQSKYLQMVTSTKGLENITTPYTIKLRSDEFYSNLDPFINAFKINKIFTNNIFFRKTKTCVYHPSDHLMSGKTEWLLNMFKESKIECETESPKKRALKAYKTICNRTQRWYRNQYSPNYIVPELHLALNHMINRGETFQEKHLVDVNSTCKKHFDVVSCDQLGQYLITWDGQSYTNIARIFDPKKDIMTMNDL
jgi:hypothetical protein